MSGTSTPAYYVSSNTVPTVDVGNAIGRWNGLLSRVDASRTYDDIARNVLVNNKSFPYEWLGLTHDIGNANSGPSCDPQTGHFYRYQIAVSVNNRTVPDVPGYRASVLVHEFGHYYGLGHEQTLVGGCPIAVMFQGLAYRIPCGVNSPTFDDKDGLDFVR